MKSLLGFFALLAASGLSAAPVSVTCGSPYSTQTVTTDAGFTSASCTSFNGDFSESRAAANAQVTLNLASIGADWSTLRTEQSDVAVQGRPGPGQGSGPGIEAHSLIHYSNLLTTTGLVRAGYLQLQFSGSVGYIYDGTSAITSGIVNPDLNSPLPPFTCAEYDGCTGNAFLAHNQMIPFTLGQAFTIEANGYFDTYAYGNDGFSGGSSQSNYNFRFLEADGLTAVEVSQAPEPSTWLLLAAPLLAGLLRSHAARKSSKQGSGSESLGSQAEQ